MRKIKRFGIPVLVVAALALVGAGFTNAVSFDATVPNAIGYGELSTEGASVSSVVYAYTNSSDQTINGETLTFDSPGIPTGEVVRVAFNDNGLSTAMTTCTNGSSTSGAFTTATCTASLAAASVTDFDVSVLPN
jgi:hypothetical protein